MTAIEPVDWDLAAGTAARLARRHSLPARVDPGLERQFSRLVSTAEALVAEATGLVSAAGPATSQVVDRATWARRNVVSFRGLLAPFTAQHNEKYADDSGRFARLSLATGRKVTALELGTMLGWMSSRVIGQYDMLMGDDGDSDKVYIVGPNLIGLEDRYGFPAEEFRLWIAIHEVTHRAQFTGIPWLRPFFLEQLAHVFGGERQSGDVLAAMRSALTDRVGTRRRIKEGGLAAVLATETQRLALSRVAGMMSLLEGHGDSVMNQAGGDLIPSANSFERVLGERRRRGNPLQRMMYRLIGFEAKLNQYSAGTNFIGAIEAVGGSRLIERCWEGPDCLPSIAEIAEPARWLDRMGIPPAADQPTADRPAADRPAARQPVVTSSTAMSTTLLNGVG